MNGKIVTPRLFLDEQLPYADFLLDTVKRDR